MEFQLSYFKSWKRMLWKCCIQYASKFVKLSSGHRTGKGQFSSNSKEKHTKECSDYRTITFILHTHKVMLKMLQARLQQYENRELPDVQAGYVKGRRTRDQIANIRWIIEKVREFQKKSASLTTLKPLTMWITTNCRKFFRRWEYQTTFSASWETCIQVKKQRLELDMEQWTGSKLEKEYVKAVYGHPCLFNFCAEKFI